MSDASRTRCDPLRRKSPLSVKLKNTMLGQKEGHGQAMAQKPQKQIYSGMINNSWKEKNRSNDWQTNTDIGGYMKIPGESAWSQHSDSAASMFPLTPGWEEDYQDLRPYCQGSLQNMSSAKEGDTKSFSCIVQDDELNTPEICIQNLNYPTQGNVLSRDDTSPMSLFEGGMWDIPPPIVSRQTSISGKVQDITSNEVVEHLKSDEKYLQTITEVGNDQLKSDKEILSDEMPIVAHEEEIISTEDVIIEESVTCDMETKSILIYDKGTDRVQFVQSVDNLNEVTMINPDMEDNLRDSDIEANLRKIESLLDDGTNLPPQDINIMNVIHDDSYASNIISPVKLEMENSMTSDLDFCFENKQFNPLTFSNIIYEEPKTQVNIKKQALNERKKLEIKHKNTESQTKSDAVQQQNVEKQQCRQKIDLSLNLAAILGAEDPISTPVILESLLGEEVSFHSLLDFIQSDGQEMKTEPIQTASTVDFSEISAVSCNSEISAVSCNSEISAVSCNVNNSIPKDEITEEAPLNVMVVQPVVIKKSPEGKLSVTQKQVSDKHIKNEVGKKPEKQTLSKKRFMKTSGKTKTFLNTNVENGSELSSDDEHMEVLTSTKQDSQKRPRGRPPRKQSASSSKNDTTYPNRQRKTSCRSEFDDIDSPPLKRSRQSSVESENDKYRELRDRNNEASRKSRLNRKTREVEMKESAERLQKENQTLRIKAEEMERLVKKLREALLEAVTKAKNK